jgi:hypothetical protein
MYRIHNIAFHSLPALETDLDLVLVPVPTWTSELYGAGSGLFKLA